MCAAAPQQQPSWEAANLGHPWSVSARRRHSRYLRLCRALPWRGAHRASSSRARAGSATQRRSQGPPNPALLSHARTRCPHTAALLALGRGSPACAALLHGMAWRWWRGSAGGACGCRPHRPRRLTRARWCRRAWRGWRSGSARTQCAGGRPTCWSTRSCRWPMPPARRPSCART